jgi:hypothetical protein
MRQKLRYLSQQTGERLASGIEENLDRYKSGNFDDQAAQAGWDIELNLDVDLGPLNELEGEGAEAEARNSLLVWSALSKMTPTLARENRIWTRLCHVECLTYARKRWLGQTDKGELISSIQTHLFANTQTKCRDDNAIGRLWWNGFIAFLAMPNDFEVGLRQLLKTADIRSNIVERSLITSRPPIAAGILRTMIRKPQITEVEETFRRFMKSINRNGGGVLFELMQEDKIDEFMDACVANAQSNLH